jgi:hypothetical protein
MSRQRRPGSQRSKRGSAHEGQSAGPATAVHYYKEGLMISRREHSEDSCRQSEGSYKHSEEAKTYQKDGSNPADPQGGEIIIPARDVTR